MTARDYIAIAKAFKPWVERRSGHDPNSADSALVDVVQYLKADNVLFKEAVFYKAVYKE